MRWVVALALAAACQPRPVTEASPQHGGGSVAAPAPKPRMVVTDTDIEILDPIEFLAGSATLQPHSAADIEKLAATFRRSASILRVAVQAYGQDTLPQFQLRLGQDRAQAIVDALLARGVGRVKLVAEGYATPPQGRSTMPIFLILERATSN